MKVSQNFPIQKISEIVTKRTVVSVAVGIGIGVVFANFVKSWNRKKSHQPPKNPAENSESLENLEKLPIENNAELRRSQSGRGLRPTSSQGERGGSLRNSMRQNSTRSLSMNPIECDISNGQELCIELRRIVERVFNNLEMVKNRSSKDMERSQKIEGILNSIKNVENDISLLFPHLEDIRDENLEFHSVSGYPASVHTGRSRTLSVLSDDSFQSAVEEFVCDIDDIDFVSEAANLNKEELIFLKEGMKYAVEGKVEYRKSRAEFCNCESETDFAAKLYCIRKALEFCLNDEHKRVWLAKCGRTLLADFIRHTKQDPIKFFNAYDEMLEFVSVEQNLDSLREDVHARGVIETGFYDVVIDFIILDAFEDLKSPPSAIYSVTKNYFMSTSMKYSTLNTIIWSIIKTKRQRLKNPDGFIAKFYNISEAVMPAITLGFLGTDERLGELCQYFKEQILQFVMDIFNIQKVCYRSMEEMSEDVWIVMRNRLEAVQTRLSNELLPA